MIDNRQSLKYIILTFKYIYFFPFLILKLYNNYYYILMTSSSFLFLSLDSIQFKSIQ